ncbi:hypothetical protein OC861_006199 [Tilletia horrida]|nr:hypothetical protein OC845_006102 [Tilletia horrida]KAK0560632.1 hypothetical protein OC861_006199 [Tilletia horrida]
MKAQFTNTAGFAVRAATSSAKALNELAIEMKTDIETIRVYGKSSLTLQLQAPSSS